MLFLKKIKSSPGDPTAHMAQGTIRHLCDRKQKLGCQPAFIFTFPPGLRLAGLCSWSWALTPPGQGRRHVSSSPGRTAGSPGTPAGPPGPQIASEAAVPPLGLPPGGPPFPRSPLLRALCVDTRGCQKKNAENMNGYEPLFFKINF